MGLIYSEIELLNPSRNDLKALTVTALVDSGAMHLCVPQHVALQLNLKELEQREVTLASGEKRVVSYVGPVLIRFGNRHCFTGAMVIGDVPLLGAIPMEDIDLVILPGTRTLAINPANPTIPGSVARETPAGYGAWKYPVSPARGYRGGSTRARPDIPALPALSHSPGRECGALLTRRN
jgi:clan AA aspartic protease